MAAIEREIDLATLGDKFPATDIEWRVGQAWKAGEKIYCKVLAYLTNRAVQQRLDDVCGPENWRNEFTAGPAGGVVCGLSVWINGRWVTKWDGAENTDIEQIKGGLSDAMKRAGVQWGIGRYLYDLGESWAEVSSSRQKGWHYGKLKDGTEFYWQPPSLPEWAVPPRNGHAPEPKVEAPKNGDDDHSLPKAPPKKTDSEKTAGERFQEALVKIDMAGTVRAVEALRKFIPKSGLDEDMQDKLLGVCDRKEARLKEHDLEAAARGH